MSSCFINQKPTLALTVLHPAPLQPFQTHPPPQISMKPIATRLSTYTESESESESNSDSCCSESDSLDPLNLADPTENAFMRHLFDAQKSLETLSNIRGRGTKVKYMGATLNSKCAPRTKFLHKQKERVIDQQIEEATKKTVYDQKKRMINDFFYPKCNNIPPPPPVHIDLSEYEELEVASPPCSLSIQQQPSARDPMPEIEADIDVDDVDAPDVSSDVNLDMNPDVNTPSLHPWVPAPEREATARAADQLEKVLQPPRNNSAGHKDPNLDLASRMQYEQMLMVLHTYSTKTTASVKEKGWIEVSHWVSAAWNRGDSYASHLRKWCCAYMCYDRFPRSPDGTPKWQTWAQHISWPPSHRVYLRL